MEFRHAGFRFGRPHTELMMIASYRLHPLPAAIALGLSPHRLGMADYRVSVAIQAPRDSRSRTERRVDQLLTALRRAGRKSVAIVDAACGDGQLIIRAARKARALGFVAIEAKGFDPSPDNVEHAWRTATADKDPAIGYCFMVHDGGEALPIEDHDADVALGDRADPELHRIATDASAILDTSAEMRHGR